MPALGCMHIWSHISWYFDESYWLKTNGHKEGDIIAGEWTQLHCRSFTEI